MRMKIQPALVRGGQSVPGPADKWFPSSRVLCVRRHDRAKPRRTEREVASEGRLCFHLGLEYCNIVLNYSSLAGGLQVCAWSCCFLAHHTAVLGLCHTVTLWWDDHVRVSSRDLNPVLSLLSRVCRLHPDTTHCPAPHTRLGFPLALGSATFPFLVTLRPSLSFSNCLSQSLLHL